MAKFHSIALASFGGLGGALAAASTISLSTSVKSIEIHFFDKDSQEKKIKFSIEYPSNSSYWEYENSSTFKNFRSVTSSDKDLFTRLFNIGHKYVEFQHYMNLVKSNKTVVAPKFCCDKNKDCKCKDNGCCMCVCCYLEDKKCCCTDASSCKSDDFLKTQKTFSYLLSNIYSGYRNIYLSPVQAYIKFPDISFSELSTESTEKSFIGSLAYGFVDYWYKPISYDSKIIPSNLLNEYISSIGTDNKSFFANIPQKIKFKKDFSDSDSSVSEINIEKLFKKVNKFSEILQLSQSSDTNAAQDCCDDKFDCLLNRNFVFLDKLENVQNSIKNTKDCCK